MYQVEIYGRIRRAVLVEGRSQRSVAREFGLARATVRKMLGHSIPPGYRRKSPAKRPKLGPWVGVGDAILEEDLTQPAKQRCASPKLHAVAESMTWEPAFTAHILLRFGHVWASATSAGFFLSFAPRNI